MNDTIIKDIHVYWELNWGNIYPNNPRVEIIFEPEKALARLLTEEVILVNTHWPEKDWPKKAQQATALFVNCSDIFAWGCADGEDITVDEIQSLYDLWAANRVWGAAKWCAFKRNEKPQAPVARDMKKDGVWDEAMDKLRDNHYDKKSVEIDKKIAHS